MCGFAGFLARPGYSASAGSAALDAMQRCIAHRGPDDFGLWHDAEAGIFLGHRRLSILDLTKSGHQPKASRSGRYMIAYNGEIYNHLDLRRDLEAHAGFAGWDGHSDTETLLAAIDVWGLERTLQAAKGMFALALWDREDRTLSLARDRMGEKPLYYGWQGNGEQRVLLFASEPKALQAHPSFDATIDRSALAAYLRFSYVPDGASIWTGIAKLRPGHIAVIDASGSITETPYWRFLSMATSAAADPFAGTAEDAIGALEGVLRTAIRRQMISDVPLGAFLSGGIDSTAIVALMQAISGQRVKTFTIGFDDSAYDESTHAEAVARHLGTDHVTMQVTPQDARDVIPQLPHIYCEPFADSSQIPTFLVSRVAREHVTVALSGDAGDEIFGGYNRYAGTARHWRKLEQMPSFLRRSAGAGAMALSPERWDQLGGAWAQRRFRTFGDKVHKAGHALGAQSALDLHFRLASTNNDPAAWLSGDSGETTTAFDDARAGRIAELSQMDDVAAMMAMDAITYLPGDILTKVDRAAMAVSLETRAPFLDPDVMSFAWSLPTDVKIRNGVTKWPLRQLLYRHVPQTLLDRPKMGFGIPVDDWVRGPLKGWAEDLLDPGKLTSEGFFDAAKVTQAWQAHLSGRRNMISQLWPVLMFQAWRCQQN